jgi:cell shape-determining protein MreD
MGSALLWLALGYASCVWDCSSSPLDPRWPSAAGVFVVSLAMRVPRFGLWGAVLFGLVLDAAHGGPLGPRVVAGVLAAAAVSHAHLGHMETRWWRVAGVSFAAITLWVLTPLVAAGNGNLWEPSRRMWDQPLVVSALSMTLIVLAIWSLIRPPEFADRDS